MSYRPRSIQCRLNIFDSKATWRAGSGFERCTPPDPQGWSGEAAFEPGGPELPREHQSRVRSDFLAARWIWKVNNRLSSNTFNATLTNLGSYFWISQLRKHERYFGIITASNILECNAETRRRNFKVVGSNPVLGKRFSSGKIYF